MHRPGLRLPRTGPRRGRAARSILTGGTSYATVVFSPDGCTLAVGGFDGTDRLWDVTDPANPRPLAQPLINGTGSAYSVAFSPDRHAGQRRR
jgi:WD40 repeat protein